MNHAWNVYKKELFTRMPDLRASLNAGASEAAVRAAEQEIGVDFPPEMRELYLANDGDNGEEVCGVLLGFHFYSLDELRSEWRGWVELAANEELNQAGSFTSTPEGRIKRRYADTKWIPICCDGGGNYIGIDLDPEEKGRAGQVINFGRDEHDKHVLEVNLNAFLERLTRLIRSDDFVIEEDEFEEDCKIICFGPEEHYGHRHLTDYLKSEDSVR